MKDERMKRILLICCLAWLTAFTCEAAQYTKEDSTRVMELLEAGRQGVRESGRQGVQEWMVFFARELRGVPYVGKTLEPNAEETLIVNLRELDCTTYVESVLALTLCMKNNKKTFSDYCHYLQLIRYEQGKVDYPTRLHYFTQWIEDNTRKGFVEEHQQPAPPFSAIQQLDINFMTTHTALYPMFNGHPEWVKTIGEKEREMTGRQYRYIPKGDIKNNSLFRKSIHDGDIIAITTSKKGLDTSHVGIAVWHKDGLHLLNASQVRKEVVEEPMTLYQYMQKHPSQTGIRVIHVK